MDYGDAWEQALKHTEVVRSRIQYLSTFQDTNVPYILLSESSINTGDTVVRSGEVVVKKPALILPPNIPQFDGFELDDADDSLMNFLLIRGINMPSLQYNNKTLALDIFEGSLTKAVNHYNKTLQQQENVKAGLVVGPEDTWQFSLLIYICSQVTRNADMDIKKLIAEYKKRQK